MTRFIAITIAFLVIATAAAQTTNEWSDLDKRFQEAIDDAEYLSLSVAIVHDDQIVYAKAFGMADTATDRRATPDTLYRIGSITKIFTALLLAQMRDDGLLRLDDPIGPALGAEFKLPTNPLGAPAITWRHLATHSSGLPRIPTNLTPKFGDPYNNYSVEQMRALFDNVMLESPIGSRYSYSNLGFGLLGYGLERVGRQPYDKLLESRILRPLGLHDTCVHIPESAADRVARSYIDHDGIVPAEDWELGVLGPAGALASTANDLARFAIWQLKAGREETEVVGTGTLAETQRPQMMAPDWKVGIGLAWHMGRDPALGALVSHDGGVSSFCSHITLAPDKRVGVVVLTNSGHSLNEIGIWTLRRAVAHFERPKTPDAAQADVAP